MIVKFLPDPHKFCRTCPAVRRYLAKTEVRSLTVNWPFEVRFWCLHIKLNTVCCELWLDREGSLAALVSCRAVLNTSRFVNISDTDWQGFPLSYGTRVSEQVGTRPVLIDVFVGVTVNVSEQVGIWQTCVSRHVSMYGNKCVQTCRYITGFDLHVSR